MYLDQEFPVKVVNHYPCYLNVAPSKPANITSQIKQSHRDRQIPILTHIPHLSLVRSSSYCPMQIRADNSTSVVEVALISCGATIIQSVGIPVEPPRSEAVLYLE